MKHDVLRIFKPNAHLKLLLTAIKEAGGRALLVGGSVRDHILGIDAIDLDIEVYGLESETLERILCDRFTVKAVGKSFGIFKVVVEQSEETQVFDVALPRTENKNAPGHKGFVVTCDPNMSFAQASLRRDFTINAMAIDLENNHLIDPHGGLNHLQEKRLRHVSSAFSEDPLRVLRAAQFCARFDLFLDNETRDLCIELKDELHTLSRERIYTEFKKLVFAQKPSIGLTVLRETQALELFPELSALIDCAQDATWHPEGDVWIHTLMVTDEAVKLIENLGFDDDTKLKVMLGAMCHDLGKPATTVIIDGKIKSPGHESKGIEPTLSFLDRMGCPQKLHDDIAALVAEHLKPFQLYNKRDEVSDGAIRRLASRVDTDLLVLVSQADFLGRTTAEALAGHDPSAPWLTARIKEVLGTQKKPEPIILGRHLIDLGLKPGVGFRDILATAFEAQLDGHFTTVEEGIEWLKKHLNMVQ